MDLGRLNESICVVCRAVSLGLVCCISKFFSPFFFPLPCVCQCNAVRACGYWFIWADILNWSYVFSPPLQIELHVYHTRARHVQVNISGYLIGHVLADVFLFRILFCTLRTVLFFSPGSYVYFSSTPGSLVGQEGSFLSLVTIQSCSDWLDYI